MEQLVQLGFKGGVEPNRTIKNKTYFKIGGTCDYFLTPTNLNDLKLIAQLWSQQAFSFHILGKGSNLLISSQHLKKCIISLERFESFISVNQNTISCSSNTTISKFIKTACESGLGGTEILAGIPASIGGSIAMNAGTHLGEICDILCEYSVFDFQSSELENIKKLDFSYRQNNQLTPSQIILSARFSLTPTESPKVLVDQLLHRRKKTQPLSAPSCGSVFKNPHGLKAWQLIDEVQMRGARCAAAQISELHPNWILNLGDATDSDVINLINKVKTAVYNKFQVSLETEVIHWKN